MIGWTGGPDIPVERPKGFGWVRLIIRLPLIAATIFGLMVPLYVVRALGYEVLGQKIVRFACRVCLRIIGIPLIVQGVPISHAGAVVANHSSWMDIFTLNAAQKVYFVSKAEVKGWPLLGPISRSTGTVFIRRKVIAAAKQKEIFLDRISKGHKLLFFPEGTSTDNRRVLEFRSSLFAAFFDDELKDKMWVQPVTVLYHAPAGQRVNLYGWWGEMNFAEHFGLVLSLARQGHAKLVFHDPLKVSDFASRKELAKACEEAVRIEFLLDHAPERAA